MKRGHNIFTRQCYPYENILTNNDEIKFYLNLPLKLACTLRRLPKILPLPAAHYPVY